MFSGKNFTGRKTALRNIPGTVRPPRSLQNYITRLTMYLRSPALPAEAYNGKIQNIYNSSKKCRRKKRGSIFRKSMERTPGFSQMRIRRPHAVCRFARSIQTHNGFAARKKNTRRSKIRKIYTYRKPELNSSGFFFCCRCVHNLTGVQ